MTRPGVIALSPAALRGRGARELRSLVDRSREVVVAAVVIGAITGLAVWGLDKVAGAVLFEHVLDAPRWVQVVAPLVGLLATWAALRWLAGGATPALSEEYVRSMVDRRGRFDLRGFAGRVVAGLATLGSGAAMGYEGLSMFVGAGVGTAVRRRFARVFGGIDPHVVLVAGAAAGVSAIFKAPATGAVFALEVPYQDDLAQGALLPALIGSASGYLVFASIEGTTPIIPVSGRPPIALHELGGALLVGIACGIGARAMCVILRWAKKALVLDPRWRLPVAGAASGLFVVLSALAFDGRPLTLGPGYQTIDFALDAKRGLLLIALLATLRVAATAATIAGGGAGGLFVPLVVQGALTGRLVAGVLGGHDQSLYVVLGIAAFLGAAYRVPLAAVTFVAEATGRPGFVVPGLVTAVVAQLLMGDESASAYQQRRHPGHLEARAELPVSSALDTDTATAGPGDTLAELYAEHVALARRRVVPVVEDDRFLGLVTLDDVLAVDPTTWAQQTVADVLRTDVLRGEPGWTVGQALVAMHEGEVDHLPIVDAAGHLRGMVTTQAILDLEDLLDVLEPPPASA